MGELHVEDRAHARAHGLRPVGVGAAGAERDAGGAERVRGAQHGADVAGVADAMQVDAQRTRRGTPPLLVDGEHARAGAQRGDAGERGALDVVEVLTAEARAGETVALERPATCARGGGDQVLAFGQERAGARALALGAQAAHGLQAGIVGGCDLAHCCLLWGSVVWDLPWWCSVRRFGGAAPTKRAPSFSGATPGRLSVGVPGPRLQRGQAADASRATSAKRRNVSASRTAMSASTLRSSSTPASLRPCMNCE